MKKKKLIDDHTAKAMEVSAYQYFVIADTSRNENPGLLVGTEVKKIGDPRPQESKYKHYGNGIYYTVLVEAPNSETRRVCCDALIPRENDVNFKLQQKMFGQIVSDLPIMADRQ